MEVKGVSVRSLLVAVESSYGADALRRVVDVLPADARAQLEPVVLASSYYPVALSAALHEAIRVVLGGGGFVANRKVGSEAARNDFRGIYRVFIRVADYATLLDGMERAWRQYNSRGRVRWDHVQAGEARGSVRDVSGYTEAMWHSIAGRLETMLVLGGAKRATVTLESWTSSEVVLHARWTP